MPPEAVGIGGLALVIAAVVVVLWRLPPRAGRTREDVHAMGFILGVALILALIGGSLVFFYSAAMLTNLWGVNPESPDQVAHTIGGALVVTTLFVAGVAALTWRLLKAYHTKTAHKDDESG